MPRCKEFGFKDGKTRRSAVGKCVWMRPWSSKREIQIGRGLTKKLITLFITCENDAALKKILSQRIYTNGKEIMPGDWIYFKNETK